MPGRRFYDLLKQKNLDKCLHKWQTKWCSATSKPGVYRYRLRRRSRCRPPDCNITLALAVISVNLITNSRGGKNEEMGI